VRRTKIVATVGPASRSSDLLRALLWAGVDVVRLNFAHGAPDEHAEVVRLLRGHAQELRRVVGVLADLPGPKIRNGPIDGDEVELEQGKRLALVSGRATGNAERISTSLDGLEGLVNTGDEIFMADGEVVLEVLSTESHEVQTRVLRGGIVRSGKGMHLPSAELSLEAFTQEDRRALQTAVELESDLVGLSFVRSAADIDKASASLPREDSPMFVAKIETRAAVGNLDEIVRSSGAVMVARGDLGIQTPLRDVPLLQKEIIARCNDIGTPVITATEMLQSMTDDPLPTRAEVGDVANAVLDGTDAVMLSEETAVGRHPVEAVRTMAEIVEAAESRGAGATMGWIADADDDRVSWAVAQAAVRAAEDVGAAAIVCPTFTGATARRVAKFRPSMPIIALSGSISTLGALTLVWGVVPLHVPDMEEAGDETQEVERAASECRGYGIVEPGSLVAVVAGSPGPRAGATDYVRIVRA
jgi:pyruvate kinase